MLFVLNYKFGSRVSSVNKGNIGNSIIKKKTGNIGKWNVLALNLYKTENRDSPKQTVRPSWLGVEGVRQTMGVGKFFLHEV